MALATSREIALGLPKIEEKKYSSYCEVPFAQLSSFFRPSGYYTSVQKFMYMCISIFAEL